MPPGIGNEGLWGVKPHRLRIEQAHIELFRVVDFEPGGSINEIGEGKCVGFGETELGEGSKFLIDFCAHRRICNPLFFHAFHEVTAEAFHPGS